MCNIYTFIYVYIYIYISICVFIYFQSYDDLLYWKLNCPSKQATKFTVWHVIFIRHHH